jgi:hypothetical protein
MQDLTLGAGVVFAAKKNPPTLSGPAGFCVCLVLVQSVAAQKPPVPGIRRIRMSMQIVVVRIILPSTALTT